MLWINYILIAFIIIVLFFMGSHTRELWKGYIDHGKKITETKIEAINFEKRLDILCFKIENLQKGLDAIEGIKTMIDEIEKDHK